MSGKQDSSAQAKVNVAMKPGNPKTKAPLLDDIIRPNKKRKTADISGPAILRQWQHKGRELRDDDEPVTANEEVVQPKQTFAIATNQKKNCFLCLRAFETADGVHAHLAGEMHSANLEKPDMVEKAHARLKRQGLSLESTVKLLSKVSTGKPSSDTSVAQRSDETAENIQYRDRAALRRQEQGHNRAQEKISLSLKNHQLSGNGARRDADDDVDDFEPRPMMGGKGKSLLEKAGWSEGQGLGNGNGVTAPIEQNLYTAGVGLGHEDSKKGDAVEEAARMTKGIDYTAYGDEVTRGRLASIMKKEKEAKVG